MVTLTSSAASESRDVNEEADDWTTSWNCNSPLSRHLLFPVQAAVAAAAADVVDDDVLCGYSWFAALNSTQLTALCRLVSQSLPV